MPDPAQQDEIGTTLLYAFSVIVIEGVKRMDARTFHVMPAGPGWKLVGEGSDTEPTIHPDQQEAVMAARAILRIAGSGQIVIHNPDGSVEEEYS